MPGPCRRLRATRFTRMKKSETDREKKKKTERIKEEKIIIYVQKQNVAESVFFTSELRE